MTLKKPVSEYEAAYPQEPGIAQYYGDCESCNVCNVCENGGSNECIWSNG